MSTVIKQAISSGRSSLGFWLTLPSSGLARSALATGGFKWAVIDGEHGLIADQHYYELVTAISASGASPIIRVPWSEEWMIKRALDAGAHGIITPMCHSAADAERIVRYSKYPPRGSRGYGPLYATHSFPPALQGPAYDSKADGECVVIVQIESRDGVANVEEIAAVEGIDVLFIGPFDLSKQMGVERGGEEHEAAIQRTLKACKENGKVAAIFCERTSPGGLSNEKAPHTVLDTVCDIEKSEDLPHRTGTDGNDSRRRLEQGFGMVSLITDQKVLMDGFNREIAVATGDQGGAKSAY